MTFLLSSAPSLLCGIAALLAVVLPAIVLGNLAFRLLSDAGLPKSLPWAGVGDNAGCLARARATLSSVFGMKALLDDGYYNYSKEGRTYVLPHILTGPEVVLPPSQARWLVEQPASVLSQHEVNRQFLEADHTLLHPNIIRDPVHPGVIRRELTHRLGSLTADMVEELERCLEENWGLDSEGWREVRVYDTMLDLISRLSTRVLVGEELSRNPAFQRSARTFDKNVVVSAAVINLLPAFLKPVVGPVVSAYDYLQYRIGEKHMMPLIKERLGQLDPEKKGLSYQAGAAAPNDYFQWAIDHALAHPDPAELSAAIIARRLACLCFAAIQSSVISTTNALFDIASSPDGGASLDAMRDEVRGEIARAEQQANGPSPWSRSALARMTHIDSALRESMRLNGFVARGIMKMVVAPDGVTLPDGSRIPCGTKVGVQAYSIHRDEDIYRDAERFDAFRFVRDDPPEAATGSAGSSSGGGGLKDRRTADRGSGDGQPQTLVSTSTTFLAFSHGTNSCPGRFFAAYQLKLTLAHIALLYEIEPIPKRPANRWFVGSMAPPLRETLRIRRRKAC